MLPVRRTYQWDVGHWSLDVQPSMTLDVRGGALCERMGLGKTLTVLMLILLDKQRYEQRSSQPGDGYASAAAAAPLPSTLVICDEHLLEQWLTEWARRTKQGRLKVAVAGKLTARLRQSYVDIAQGHMQQPLTFITSPHGKVEQQLVQQEEFDVLLMSEKSFVREMREWVCQRAWRRVVVDEAQRIEEAHSCRVLLHTLDALKVDYRWAVTGTPWSQRALMDIHGIFRAFRFSPFIADQRWWKKCFLEPYYQGDEQVMAAVHGMLNVVIWRHSAEAVHRFLPPIKHQQIKHLTPSRLQQAAYLVCEDRSNGREEAMGKACGHLQQLAVMTGLVKSGAVQACTADEVVAVVDRKVSHLRKEAVKATCSRIVHLSHLPEKESDVLSLVDHVEKLSEHMELELNAWLRRTLGGVLQKSPVSAVRARVELLLSHPVLREEVTLALLNLNRRLRSYRQQLEGHLPTVRDALSIIRTALSSDAASANAEALSTAERAGEFCSPEVMLTPDAGKRLLQQANDSVLHLTSQLESVVSQCFALCDSALGWTEVEFNQLSQQHQLCSDSASHAGEDRLHQFRLLSAVGSAASTCRSSSSRRQSSLG